MFSQFNVIDGKKFTGTDDRTLPFRAGLLDGMHYLAEPLIQWRKHEANGTDRMVGKTVSELMFSESSITYDVGALIYMAEEFFQFEKEQTDKALMAEINRDLETAFIKLAQRWAWYRVSLDLEGFSPTWIDKKELEKQ